MSLFARRHLAKDAAGWQPNQKTVIADHETRPGIPTAETPSLLKILKNYLIKISVVRERQEITNFKYLTARVNPDVFITSKRVVFETNITLFLSSRKGAFLRRFLIISSMKTEQMSSENYPHLCSTLIFKARLDKMIFFVNCFFWFSLFPVTSTLVECLDSAHLCGHKDRSWLTSHEPMMSLFVRQLLLPRAAGR